MRFISEIFLNFVQIDAAKGEHNFARETSFLCESRLLGMQHVPGEL